jgi:hypothetical protein
VTSLKDDTVGGDTDGVVESPGAGDWDRIYFRTGSSGTLSYVEFRYGGDSYYDYGAVHILNASPSLTYCVIRNNVRGVSSSGTAANPLIHNCEIYNNTEYGVYNATSGHWIDATNNWWGSDGGPHDPSSADGLYNYNPSGDRVSDYVLYTPWMVIAPYRIYLPVVLKAQ